MFRAIRDIAARNALGLFVAGVALSLQGCPGSDPATAPVVSAGGTYFSAWGDAASAVNLGGSGNSGATVATSDASVGAYGFDWGPSNYDKTGGSNVSHQDHSNGEPCFASCHDPGITIGGTAYLANGVELAPNVQIGVWLSGTLFVNYSGANGNFFSNFLGDLDWAHAKIAARDVNGTRVMPPNPNANGNCNSCHDRTHRIVVP